MTGHNQQATGQRPHSAVSTVLVYQSKSKQESLSSMSASSANPAGGGDEAAGYGGLGMQGGGGRAADGNGEWSPRVSSTPSHRSTAHLSTIVVDLLSPLSVAKIGGCHGIQSDTFGLHRYFCRCIQDSRKRIGE